MPFLASYQSCLDEAHGTFPSIRVILQSVAEYLNQPCHLQIRQIQFGTNTLIPQIILREVVRLLLYLEVEVPPIEVLRKQEPLKKQRMTFCRCKMSTC